MLYVVIVILSFVPAVLMQMRTVMLWRSTLGITVLGMAWGKHMSYCRYQQGKTCHLVDYFPASTTVVTVVICKGWNGKQKGYSSRP